MSAADSITVPASDDAPIETPAVEETPVETPAVEEPSTEEPAVEEPTTEEPAPDATAAAEPTAEPTEELEEGIIKSKDAKGKYKYNLDENRYKTVYGNHQLVQKAAELLHEPLTLEGIEQFQKVNTAHDRMWDHLTSGDPAQQSNVIKEFITEMQAAHTDGETGVDPSIPFAAAVYENLRDNAPEAYASLRLQAARDLLTEMYEQAAASKNRDLYSSAQQMAITLAGVGPKPEGMTNEQYAAHIKEVTENSQIPFHTLQEMDGLVRTEDPTSALARENAELKARLAGRTTATQTEQFGTWTQNNQQSVNKAIFEDAVQPTLASVADGWKDFPDDYKRLVVDPLNNEVTNALRSDQDLIQRTKELRARAQRATSESKRQEIGAEIQQLFVNRARIAADKAKGPIFNSGANALKGLSATNNTRRAAAQTRTAPNGTGTPVKHSVLPEAPQFKNGMFDSGTAMKQALAAFNTGR